MEWHFTLMQTSLRPCLSLWAMPFPTGPLLHQLSSSVCSSQALYSESSLPEMPDCSSHEDFFFHFLSEYLWSMFIHSFAQYLFCAYDRPATALVTGDIGGCKTGNSCAHWSSILADEVYNEEHQNLIYEMNETQCSVFMGICFLLCTLLLFLTMSFYWFERERRNLNQRETSTWIHCL